MMCRVEIEMKTSEENEMDASRLSTVGARVEVPQVLRGWSSGIGACPLSRRLGSKRASIGSSRSGVRG